MRATSGTVPKEFTRAVAPKAAPSGASAARSDAPATRAARRTSPRGRKVGRGAGTSATRASAVQEGAVRSTGRGTCTAREKPCAAGRRAIKAKRRADNFLIARLCVALPSAPRPDAWVQSRGTLQEKLQGGTPLLVSRCNLPLAPTREKGTSPGDRECFRAVQASSEEPRDAAGDAVARSWAT